MTERVDHAANSRRAIDTVHDWQGREGETDATMLAEVGIAQAEATLALVEQPKVANLTALLKETFASHQALEALSDIATARFGEQIGLRPEVAAVLGIKAVGHD